MGGRNEKPILGSNFLAHFWLRSASLYKCTHSGNRYQTSGSSRRIARGATINAQHNIGGWGGGGGGGGRVGVGATF